MTHILHLDSSPRSVGVEGIAARSSVSRALTKQFIQEWQNVYPDGSVTYRDIGQNPVPPIDEAWIAAAFAPAEQLTPSLKMALMISDQLIDELLAADFLVFGIPMYNYSVPANFKAYIDQIVRVKRTFLVEAVAMRVNR